MIAVGPDAGILGEVGGFVFRRPRGTPELDLDVERDELVVIGWKVPADLERNKVERKGGGTETGWSLELTG
jgi:hypothetical protein